MPRHGAEGAGIALVITEAVSVAAAGTWLYHVTRYPTPLWFAIRLLPPVALTITALWFARSEPVILRLALLVVVYAASVLIVGPVRMQELRALLGRNRKGRSFTPVEEADVAREQPQ